MKPDLPFDFSPTLASKFILGLFKLNVLHLWQNESLVDPDDLLVEKETGRETRSPKLC